MLGANIQVPFNRKKNIYVFVFVCERYWGHLESARFGRDLVARSAEQGMSD